MPGENEDGILLPQQVKLAGEEQFSSGPLGSSGLPTEADEIERGRAQGAIVLGEIRQRGGWCHRRFFGQAVVVAGKIPGTGSHTPFDWAGHCVGRFGICQLWDAELGQCLDRTQAEATIASARASQAALSGLQAAVAPQPEAAGGPAPGA